MIKLIPHKYLEKEELINNLMAGRRYTRADSLAGSYAVLHWDKAHIRSPFRYGLKPWDWRGMSELKEITESHWYDNIPEEGVLCWVSDTNYGDKIRAYTIYAHNPGLDYPFESNGDLGDWKYATPVLPSQLYQEPV